MGFRGSGKLRGLQLDNISQTDSWAGWLGHGGEVSVLDMTKPVKIGLCPVTGRLGRARAGLSVRPGGEVARGVADGGRGKRLVDITVYTWQKVA